MSSSAKVSWRPARAAAGEHRIADDPELAPVARLAAGIRRSRPGLRPGARGSRCGAAGGRARAWPRCSIGSPTKSASSPPNMRRAERFIHSMPPSATVTMPTSTESRMARVRSACSGQRLARAVALVDVDEGADHAGLGSSASSTGRTRHLHPEQAAVAPAQPALAAEAAVLAQAALDLRPRSRRSRARPRTARRRRARSARAGIAGQRGHAPGWRVRCARRAGRRCPPRTG